jgi:hypothetical protein
MKNLVKKSSACAKSNSASLILKSIMHKCNFQSITVASEWINIRTNKCITNYSVNKYLRISTVLS